MPLKKTELAKEAALRAEQVKHSFSGPRDLKIIFSPLHGVGEFNGRTIVFELNGPSFFDDAQFEGGKILRLGLGQGRARQERALRVRKTGPAYTATTTDGVTNFKIRLMDIGVVEMRQYNAASGALQNILYGK